MTRIFATLATLFALALPLSAAALGDDGLHKPTWLRDTFKDLRDDLADANAEPLPAAPEPFGFRASTAYVASHRLALAQLPIDAPIEAGDTQIELDRMVLGLSAGQPVALVGERADLPGTGGGGAIAARGDRSTGPYTNGPGPGRPAAPMACCVLGGHPASRASPSGSGATSASGREAGGSGTSVGVIPAT